jgi:hypothetical protein
MNLNTKPLLETESKLISPELIGTDAEKIAALQYWSEIVGLFRSLNTTIISFDNKTNIIAAIKAELELIEMELHNVSAVPSNEPGEIPSMEMVPTEEIVDLSTPEKPKTEAKHFFSQEAIAKLRRNAGVA